MVAQPQETKYRTFPIIKRKRNEHHVFLGFDSNQKAEEWISWGIRERFLVESLKEGEPGRPAKAPPPRAPD